jgi:hypothetical protein
VGDGMLFVHWIGDGKRCGRLSTATRGCGGGPARSCARGEEMPWNRGARVSKEDHRAAAEHVLRLGEVQRARAGAGDAGGTRGSSSGGGTTWRGQERASAGRGSDGADAGAARGTRKGGVGAAHGRQERRRVRQRKIESRGLEVDEGGAISNFPKV